MNLRPSKQISLNSSGEMRSAFRLLCVAYRNNYCILFCCEVEAEAFPHTFEPPSLGRLVKLLCEVHSHPVHFFLQLISIQRPRLGPVQTLSDSATSWRRILCGSGVMLLREVFGPILHFTTSVLTSVDFVLSRPRPACNSLRSAHVPGWTPH